MLHPNYVVVCVCPSQVDALGRQLARGAADGEELGAQRENLLAELASAQQVRLHAQVDHTGVHACKRRCTWGGRHPPAIFGPLMRRCGCCWSETARTCSASWLCLRASWG